MRRAYRKDALGAETRWFSVDNLNEIRFASQGDVMTIVPRFTEPAVGVEPHTMQRDALADDAFLQNSVEPMDFASFIGFPGASGVEWWDQLSNSPIARMLNIASIPRLPFSNSAIPTGNVMLVSGLSISGSSGSPVITHQKGVQVGQGLIGDFTPPKIIEVMSGHFTAVGQAGFAPSGLSYLTRSTSITELLDSY